MGGLRPLVHAFRKRQREMYTVNAQGGTQPRTRPHRPKARDRVWILRATGRPPGTVRCGPLRRLPCCRATFPRRTK